MTTTIEPDEIWLPVLGGLYEVSNLGVVRTTRRRNNRWPAFHKLRQFPDKDGYKKVTVLTSSKRMSVYVHILVMLAFVGEKPQGLQVNHKDGVKSNNWVSNLEYTTPQENVRHSVRLGLHVHGDQTTYRKNPLMTRGINNVKHKLTEDQVREIIRRKVGGEIVTITRIAKEYGISIQAMSAILKGRHWKHIWSERSVSPSLEV